MSSDVDTEALDDDSEPAEAEPVAAPKKKKRKKKRKKKPALDVDSTSQDETNAASAAEPDPQDDELPGIGTPEGDRLRQAFRAFEAGDYKAARAHVAALEEAEDDDVRVMARDLARRMAIDPIQLGVVAACFGVLVWIVWTWIIP